LVSVVFHSVGRLTSGIAAQGMSTWGRDNLAHIELPICIGILHGNIRLHELCDGEVAY
jgi:hypothetical protein